MAKQLYFKKDGKEYILEYSRKAAKQMEAVGFEVTKMMDKPVTMLPMLFSGAFLMHHPSVTEEQKDVWYKDLQNKEDLIASLTDMYSECVNTLFETEGNLEWSKNW